MEYCCNFCNKKFKKLGLKNHENWCDKNPNKKDHPSSNKESWNKGLTKDIDDRVKKTGETFRKNIKSGKTILNKKPLSSSHKEAVSIGMKKAHKEGKAWNIGMSRWNNKPSYPEEFFMKVIENEFEDKKYKREYNVGKYSIDFAWVNKKLAIEIDGSQHERFEDIKERDKQKDLFLISEGWKVLRIKWKDLFHNTKNYIDKAKHFISLNTLE